MAYQTQRGINSVKIEFSFYLQNLRSKANPFEDGDCNGLHVIETISLIVIGGPMAVSYSLGKINLKTSAQTRLLHV